MLWLLILGGYLVGCTVTLVLVAVALSDDDSMNEDEWCGIATLVAFLPGLSWIVLWVLSGLELWLGRRRRVDDRRRATALAAATEAAARRRSDVEFWLSREATGPPVEAEVARQVLALLRADEEVTL